MRDAKMMLHIKKFISRKVPNKMPAAANIDDDIEK